MSENYEPFHEEEDWGFMDDLMCRDPEEALRWHHLAADQGDCDAQVALGDVFWHAKNWEESAVLYRQAAHGGDAGSQLMLGHMIYSGVIQGKLKEMVHWYFRASGTEWMGRFMMGECYRHGRGLPQNYEKAMRWFLMGDAEADVQKRRLAACHAFYKSTPAEYAQAYAIETGKEGAGRKNSWMELTPEQLQKGLQRLTEYEVEVDLECVR